jgi:hypothetical protein
MAERVGFEPTVPLPAHVLSRHADSAALAPLHEKNWLYLEETHLSMHLDERQAAVDVEPSRIF